MNFWRKWCAVILLALSSTSASAQKDAIGSAIDETVNAGRAAKASQQRIDSLDDQSRAMLERYRAASWHAHQLTVYADQLDELVDAQDSERESIARQVKELERTEQALQPLMQNMVSGLERFLELDLPFLVQERRQRLVSLKALMADPGASNADRFKRILEVLQIESEYGRTLGAERAEVNGRSVDVLRLGRVALYFLSADGEQAGIWMASQKKWADLPYKHVSKIRDGLRMAREYAAPDLLELPLPKATRASK